MKRIAVVEDDIYMREELVHTLENAGYSVSAAEVFDDIITWLQSVSPQLVLMDINLPGISGFYICREVKQKSTIPVVMLTSRDQMKDELHALDIGADEYLTKPCRRERLLARLANVIKRYEGRANLLEGNGFLLDRQTYTLYIHDASVVLPKNQGKLLAVFLMRSPSVVTKNELSQALWGTLEFIDENALQVNLTRLKKTMTQLRMKQKLVPVRGIGYQLIEGEEPDEG